LPYVVPFAVIAHGGHALVFHIPATDITESSPV
jgi:hypothetical protein